MTLCIQAIIPCNDPPSPPLSKLRSELEDRKGGFPHSEICGSKGARASPHLIAACHVLHRLSAPRHPSEALQRLIVSQQNPCMSCAQPGERCPSSSDTHGFICQTMSSLKPVLKANLLAGQILHSRCQSPDHLRRYAVRMR